MTPKEYLDQRLRDVTGGLVAALERKHPYTKGHSVRVEMYAAAIATYMRKPYVGADLENARIAARCHDIGKLCVEGATLNNQSRLLSTDQVVEIEDHPYHGVQILRKSGVPIPRMVLDGIFSHHERWDGLHNGDLTGYPLGLKGKQIPLVGRIIAIADTFDALTTPRSYQAPHSEDEACQIIRAQAGKKLDPTLVKVFLELALPKCRALA